jgi:signal transduction histidine kinase
MRSVLIADDEQVIRDLFVKLLNREGYVVSTAVDGLETLEKIRKDSFNVVILDLKMPKMGGMELLDKIRALNEDLMIIVVTGYATVDTAKEAIKKGCFDYITKPFNTEDISNIIRRAFDMRAMIAEKRKLEMQLETSERLASLAHMGAGVAHEVNTVLTSAKLYLEMLRTKLPKNREGKNINLILEEVERAEKLITRFLKFTRPVKPEFLKKDINTVIKRSSQVFKYRLNKQKIIILNELSKGIPEILCDPSQMEEVFLNLFSNCIDAMPDGGHITIKSQGIGIKAVITISDTGIGISKENEKKLFDPFFTTKAHGTGLGLSIVHRIIEEHKGTIAITSEENKGTVVQIELPIKVQE